VTFVYDIETPQTSSFLNSLKYRINVDCNDKSLKWSISDTTLENKNDNQVTTPRPLPSFLISYSIKFCVFVLRIEVYSMIFHVESNSLSTHTLKKDVVVALMMKVQISLKIIKSNKKFLLLATQFNVLQKKFNRIFSFCGWKDQKKIKKITLKVELVVLKFQIHCKYYEILC